MGMVIGIWGKVLGQDRPPLRRQWKEEAEAPGHLKHSDEIPSTLYVCLSLKFHSWADGIVPLWRWCPNFYVDIVWQTWRNVNVRNSGESWLRGCLKTSMANFPVFDIGNASCSIHAQCLRCNEYLLIIWTAPWGSLKNYCLRESKWIMDLPLSWQSLS